MNQIAGEDNYAQLLKDITGLFAGTRGSLLEAYWITGKYITAVEEKLPERVGYGKHLIGKLSEDLAKKYGKGFSRTNLKDMRLFYKTYPIGQPAGQLEWTKVVMLLSVKDEKSRNMLLKKAVEENMTRSELQKHIELYRLKETGKEKREEEEYPVTRGDLYCYKRIDLQDGNTDREVTIDCGFNVWRSIKIENLAEMKNFLLFKTEKKKDRYFISEEIDNSDGNSNRFHTYCAGVAKVIDGDTLWLTIDTGFKTTVRQKIRLRGIDTPEINFSEGKKAREFVMRELRGCNVVVVKTYKTDKYARYIGDIFYLKGEEDPVRICSEGKLLNRELLVKGHAREIQFKM